MAEHIEGACTPLRRSRRLGKGSPLAITEELGPLKETEDELRAVKAEEEEEKHGDKETGLGFTAAPLERGQVPHGGEVVVTAAPLERGQVPHGGEVVVTAAPLERGQVPHGGEVVVTTAPLERGQVPHGGEVVVTAAPLERGQVPHGGEVVVTAAPLERGQVPHGGEVVVTAAPLERGQVPHGGEVVVTAAPLERGQVPHGGEVVVTAAPLERGQAPHGGEVVLANEEDTVQAEVDTIQLPAPPMCVPAASKHFEEKKTHLESATEPCKRPLLGAKDPKVKSASLSGKREVAVPKGKPKSGRVWKDQNKKRFSGMVKDRPLHTSWDKKMAARREKSLMKDYSQRLKDEKQKAKEEKKRRREENLKRRLENERKAEVVQVITNLAKLKRAKKKQLRRIEKRDTLALVQRGSGINKKAERLEIFLKKKRETTEAKENTN